MSYAASTAFDYSRFDYETAEPKRAARMSLIKGGGLDAKARKAVPRQFISVLTIVFFFTIVFFVLGAVRVTITAETLSLLRKNSAMQSQIEQMNDENNNLRIERSSLASSERIVAIATGTYGMHQAVASESISLSADAAAEPQAEPVAAETQAEPVVAEPQAEPVAAETQAEPEPQADLDPQAETETQLDPEPTAETQTGLDPDMPIVAASMD